MTISATCYPTKKSDAGQVVEFCAEITAHENPWVVGSERRYELRGTLVSGIPESADVPGASVDEMAAIVRGLQFIENYGRDE